jgi:hypothetical protein
MKAYEVLIHIHLPWLRPISWSHYSEFFEDIENLGSASISESEFTLDERSASFFRFFDDLDSFFYDLWIFVLVSLIAFENTSLLGTSTICYAWILEIFEHIRINREFELIHYCFNFIGLNEDSLYSFWFEISSWIVEHISASKKILCSHLINDRT